MGDNGFYYKPRKNLPVSCDSEEKTVIRNAITHSGPLNYRLLFLYRIKSDQHSRKLSKRNEFIRKLSGTDFLFQVLRCK